MNPRPDALDYAEREHRRDDNERVTYQVQPRVVYPMMVAYIRQALGETPADVTHGLRPKTVSAIRPLLQQAKALPPEAWELALVPRADVEAANLITRLRNRWPDKETALSVRGQALEIARLWFTELLHERVGYMPLRVHITKDERWRL